MITWGILQLLKSCLLSEFSKSKSLTFSILPYMRHLVCYLSSDVFQHKVGAILGQSGPIFTKPLTNFLFHICVHIILRNDCNILINESIYHQGVVVGVC